MSFSTFGLWKSLISTTKSSTSEKPAESEDPKIEALLEQVGPHTYVLINHRAGKVRFCVTGCQGEKHDESEISPQKLNAAFINELAASEETKADIFLVLGDNFYPKGITNARDLRFKLQFYDAYHSDETPNIKGIPGFVLLGNHDANFQSWEKAAKKISMGSLTGKKLEMHQVYHSYLTHEDDPHITDKVEFYSQETLDYTQLPRWNMPYFYYSVIVPALPEKSETDSEESEESEKSEEVEDRDNNHGGVQLFMVDSNYIVKDYMEYIKFMRGLYPTASAASEGEGIEKESEKERDTKFVEACIAQFTKTNQFAWLLDAYRCAKKAGRTTILAMHHPVITRGKRAYPKYGDAELYLSYEELVEANHEFGFDASSKRYNALIEKLLEREGINFDTYIAAHDHFLSYYKDERHTQIVSGGGGSARENLQKPEYFENWENLGCFIRENGAVYLTIDKCRPAPIEIEYRTASGVQLKFTSDSNKPVREAELIDIDPNITAIREILFSCFARYHVFLTEQCRIYPGNFYLNPVGFSFGCKHPNSDVCVMYEIMNYLNKPYDDELRDVIRELHRLIEKLTNREQGHSLYNDICKTFRESDVFHQTIEEMYEGLFPIARFG